jgi:hypothetical protein
MTTTKQQVAKVADKSETNGQASPDAREAPIIKSAALNWQSQGHSYREAFVRLPDGLLLQDLQDVPSVWKNVQQVPSKALQRFDRVTAVAFDESWMIKDVVVVDANVDRVTLAIRPNDRISLPTKTGGEWQDERHSIRWAGSGFGVFRKSDGVPVLQAHFGSIEAAKSEMYRVLYNRAV